MKIPPALPQNPTAADWNSNQGDLANRAGGPGRAREQFPRLLLATVLVLTILAGACGTGTPTQAPRVSQTPGSANATPMASQTPQASQTPGAPTIVPAPTSNPTLVAGGLIGLWQGDNGSFYLFIASQYSDEGTWKWDQVLARVESTPAKQGRWRIYGDDFFLQDVTGKDLCPLLQEGPYHAHLVADTLTLKRGGDQCSARVTRTDGQYTRLAAAP